MRTLNWKKDFGSEFMRMTGYGRYKFIYADGSSEVYDGRPDGDTQVFPRIRCKRQYMYMAVAIIDLADLKFIKNRTDENDVRKFM